MGCPHHYLTYEIISKVFQISFKDALVLVWFIKLLSKASFKIKEEKKIFLK
jgi:hypothetical protein